MPHHIVFAALPDGHTVLGIQFCRNGEHRAFLNEVNGLLLNVPNDIFNGCRRTLVTARGRVILRSPPRREELRALGSPWAVVDGRLGIMGLYGAPGLVVARSPARRGGPYASLFCEEVCLNCRREAWAAAPEQIVLDVGWAVQSSVTAAGMRAFAAANAAAVLPGLPPGLRAVRVVARDGARYLLALNTGAAPQALPPPDPPACAGELGGDRTWHAGGPPVVLAAGEAALFREPRGPGVT